MRSLLPLVFVLCSLPAFSNESFVFLPYTLLHDSLDTTLDSEEAVFNFDLTLLAPGLRDSSLVYSVDSTENQYYNYSDGDTLSMTLTPGQHTFQFYGGLEYAETSVIHLTIETQHRQLYRINFQRVFSQQMNLRKPVIYLYPKETTDVSIKVNPIGDFTFTYPNIAQGWDFTCHPDGRISREDESYRYLFWESEQEITPELVNPKQGAIVNGSEAVAFLESQMTQYGMTKAEQADLLTYWGPLMQNKTNVYIYLLFNEVCDAFASLEITPKPTEIGRFYVVWAEVPEYFNPKLEVQEIPTMNREGFTVLEWGGAEVKAESILMKEL